MKQLLILICLFSLKLSAQDTIYLNGTTKVSFNLGKTVKLWYNGCTEYTAATTERTVTGFGKVQIKTDGNGYVTPIAGAKATFKYYNRNCDVLTPYTVTFMTKVVVNPPPTDTTGEGGGSTGSTVTIMSIGDSNTEGYPTTTLLGSYRTRLDLLMGSKYDFIGRKNGGNFTDNQHEGYSGIDIGGIMYDHVMFGSMFTNNKPDVILLMIGTNDVNGFNGMSPNNDPIATAPNRVEDLITQIRNKTPNSVIIVCSILPIYPNTMGQGDVSKCITFNTQVAQFVQARNTAGQQVYYADFFSKFGPADFSDGLHLTLNGYNKLADELKTILNGLGYL